jgi:translation initiation factor 3 subunit A
VGQPHAALQALHDVITSKRHRTWQKVLETIMFKYVELCIQLKKGRLAKDGLIQYRIVCQQVNVQSLEEVIKHFLKLATDKAEAAQAAAAATAESATMGVDDLEAENTPENLMLKSVSAESDKDRADRELVTPWFKFLWEAYRTVLEILRNNNKLEALYAMTANRAFNFCVTYKRTTEFRRLCEILRNHLSNLQKYRDQRDRPDMTLPETQQYYLETRFEQLKAAADLELWQEAFRTVEDIHGLTLILKKSPNPRMMASYFAKLTKVFWVSENYLYHAYAWYKLFNLSKTYNRNLPPADLKAMASAVLLSAVAIPPYESRTSASASNQELENAKERDVRMASLLGYNLDPKRDPREVLSRKALISELISKGILSLVSTEAVQCYALFEKEFHPLDLCKHAEKVFGALKTAPVELSAASPIPTIVFDEFLPRMRSLAVVRMLQQSSQVYQTMKLETLQQMVPFLEFSQVERILVDATKGGAVSVRLDHQNKCVRFEGEQLESDNIKNHLVLMAQKLRTGVKMMYPDAAPAASLATQSNSEDLLAKIEREHELALARKVIIERRKEEQERVVQEHEKAEEEARVALQRKHEAAEAKRLEEERHTREQTRIQQEMDEKEKQEALALIAEAERRNVGKGKKGFKIKLEEGQKLDKRSLMQDAIKEQIKERQDMERKLVRLAKSMDHLERAKREEEVPLIEAAYKVKMSEDEKYHMEMQQQNGEKHKAAWEVNIEEKKRLAKMTDEKDQFASAIVSRRSEEFEALRVEREERITEMRALRRAERELARRRAYVRRLQQIEEEARAAAAEAERERLEDEERARRAAEEEEEDRKRAAQQKEQESRFQPRRGGDGDSGRYEARRGDDRRDDRRGDDRSGGGEGRYEPRRYEARGGGRDDRGGGGSDRYGGGGGGGDRYGGGGGRGGDDRRGPSRYDERGDRGGGGGDRGGGGGDRDGGREGGGGGGGGGGGTGGRSRW